MNIEQQRFFVNESMLVLKLLSGNVKRIRSLINLKIYQLLWLHTTRLRLENITKPKKITYFWLLCWFSQEFRLRSPR